MGLNVLEADKVLQLPLITDQLSDLINRCCVCASRNKRVKSVNKSNRF